MANRANLTVNNEELAIFFELSETSDIRIRNDLQYHPSKIISQFGIQNAEQLRNFINDSPLGKALKTAIQSHVYTERAIANRTQLQQREQQKLQTRIKIYFLLGLAAYYAHQSHAAIISNDRNHEDSIKRELEALRNENPGDYYAIYNEVTLPFNHEIHQQEQQKLKLQQQKNELDQQIQQHQDLYKAYKNIFNNDTLKAFEHKMASLLGELGNEPAKTTNSDSTAFTEKLDQKINELKENIYITSELVNALIDKGMPFISSLTKQQKGLLDSLAINWEQIDALKNDEDKAFALQRQLFQKQNAFAIEEELLSDWREILNGKNDKVFLDENGEMTSTLEKACYIVPSALISGNSDKKLVFSSLMVDGRASKQAYLIEKHSDIDRLDEHDKQKAYIKAQDFRVMSRLIDDNQHLISSYLKERKAVVASKEQAIKQNITTLQALQNTLEQFIPTPRPTPKVTATKKEIRPNESRNQTPPKPELKQQEVVDDLKQINKLLQTGQRDKAMRLMNELLLQPENKKLLNHSPELAKAMERLISGENRTPTPLSTVLKPR